MKCNPDNYFSVLGVSPGVDFECLKKAYFRRAKEYHPDRFGGDPAKEEHFKRIVEAFDVLSDPTRRRAYERSAPLHRSGATGSSTHGFYFGEDEEAVLDSIADDILEELVVGNNIPRYTTLQSLMLDLEHTEKFLRFREGKNLFAEGCVSEAHKRFEKAVEASPSNILYRYYLARSFACLSKWRKSEKQLRVGIQLGATRIPPLRLQRFHDEIKRIRKNHRGLLGRLRARDGEQSNCMLLPEEEMKQRTAKTIDRLYRSKKYNRARLPE